MCYTSVGRPWYQRHGSGWMCHVSGLTYFEPQGAVAQALTRLHGAWFIALCPFLGECRRGPWHFWECRAYLGYSPCDQIHFKKALCHTRPFDGACDKYRYSPQSGMTRTQLLLKCQYPIRLTPVQSYQITILNLDGNRLPTLLSEFVTTVAT